MANGTPKRLGKCQFKSRRDIALCPNQARVRVVEVSVRLHETAFRVTSSDPLTDVEELTFPCASYSMCVLMDALLLGLQHGGSKDNSFVR